MYAACRLTSAVDEIDVESLSTGGERSLEYGDVYENELAKTAACWGEVMQTSGVVAPATVTSFMYPIWRPI